jgi:exopolysaccharide biosynthesis polyprenyl glycosylphosphotransferase
MFERLGRRLAGSILIWDLVLTLLCLYVSSPARLAIEWGAPITPSNVDLPWPLYLAVACIWTTIFLLLAPQRDIISRPVVEALGRLLVAVVLAVLAFAGLLYLSVREVSRLQFLYFAAFDLAALLLFHLAARAYVRLRGRYHVQRRMLIVGGGAQAEQLANELQRRLWTGVRVVGCTSDQPLAGDSLPMLGPVSATLEVIEQQQIDEVIFASIQREEITNLSLQLQQKPVMLHMMPSVLDLAFAGALVTTLGGIPLISLRESALSESQRLFKRVFDLVGSAILLLIFSPLLLLIALLIKLESPGPVFFLQERLGEHGQRFKLIKFRSMRQDAEQLWREVAGRQEDGHLIHKTDDDPRVTRVGRKLRRTSLDELPNLFNVLRGEMSLVGPRPEIPYMTAEYQPWQWQRFRVPPGITGWWQVNGRSARPMHLHTEDDLYYIQNYSFWLDLKILWMTIFTVLKGHGAF